MIDFALTAVETDVRDKARAFATEVLAPRAAARDKSGDFPIEELRGLARLGLLGVNVPVGYGGLGAGVVAYSQAMQEVARADASVSVAMAVTNMVAEVIVAFGTESQRRKSVPLLTSGEAVAGAFALSEPQAGSDPGAMATRATKIDGGWRLDGNKQWITSGDRAGVFVVWAKTDATQGTRGISAFVVHRSNRGLHAGKHEDKMGLRGSSTVPLVLDDCRVTDDDLLGNPGDGFKIAMVALDGGRIGIASQACGVASAALHKARGFAALHKDEQYLLLRLADMATELDAARLLTHRAAWLKGGKRPFTREASMAKLYASEAAGRITDAAVSLGAELGAARDGGVERLVRDARVQRIYEGTSEVQRIVIGRTLLQSSK